MVTNKYLYYQVSSIQLCTRLFDLLWYNSVGFDSLISPSYVFHSFLLMTWISVKQLNKKKSNISQITGLNVI